MALDDGEKLQVAERVKTDIEASLSKKIPRLMKLEAFASSMMTIVGAVVAVPLALYGLYAFVEKQTKASIEEINKKDTNNAALKLSTFSKGLQQTFVGQADSATFKLLRFGCNVPDVKPAPSFPTCAAATVATTAPTQQARATLDEQDQTISFAARTKRKQSVSLTLTLRSVDSREVLRNVALRMHWAPVDTSAEPQESSNGDAIPLSDELVSEKNFLVAGSEPQILLFAVPKDAIDKAPLQLTVNLTPALEKIDNSLHKLVIRTVLSPEGEKNRAEAMAKGMPWEFGSERFHLRALVSVNHVLDMPP